MDSAAGFGIRMAAGFRLVKFRKPLRRVGNSNYSKLVAPGDLDFSQEAKSAWLCTTTKPPAIAELPPPQSCAHSIW